MALPEFNLRQLLEAGVHFGHQTHRWNPRMDEFIYGERNGIHIIDLTQTVSLLDAALNVIRETVAKGGRVLFVGTKRQASVAIGEAASRSAQHYINNRWLGGTLTNWNTVSKSIQHLDQINETLNEDVEGLTKKERLKLERVRDKLEANLGGIRDMGGTPDLLFIVDVKKEALAVAEANKLGIPVVGIVDSNCSPDGVDHIIPGNDDASRAIKLYCELASRAALDGMSAQLGAAGIDIGGLEGEQSEPALENLADDQTNTEESRDEPEKVNDDATDTEESRDEPEKVNDDATDTEESRDEPEKVNDDATDTEESRDEPEKVNDDATDTEESRDEPEKVNDDATDTEESRDEPEKVNDDATDKVKCNCHWNCLTVIPSCLICKMRFTDCLQGSTCRQIISK